MIFDKRGVSDYIQIYLIFNNYHMWGLEEKGKEFIFWEGSAGRWYWELAFEAWKKVLWIGTRKDLTKVQVDAVKKDVEEDVEGWRKKKRTEHTTEHRKESRESVDTQTLLTKLKRAKSTANTVRHIAGKVDVAEALVSIIPELGDLGASGVLAAFYSTLGARVGFTKKEYGRIYKILGIDVLVGAVPILGDAGDFFYKSASKIATVFEDHFNNLFKKAQKAGVPAEVLASIKKDEKYDDHLVDKVEKGKLSDLKDEAEKMQEEDGTGDVVAEQMENLQEDGNNIADTDDDTPRENA
jgi:hypothetical protein